MVGTDASSRRHATGLHRAALSQAPLVRGRAPSNFFFFFFCEKIRRREISYGDQLSSAGKAKGMRTAPSILRWQKSPRDGASAKFNAEGTNSIQRRTPRRAMRRCIELTNMARSGEEEYPLIAAALAAVLSAKWSTSRSDRNSAISCSNMVMPMLFLQEMLSEYVELEGHKGSRGWVPGPLKRKEYEELITVPWYINHKSHHACSELLSMNRMP